MSGTYIHTLAATDVSSGWTECVPLLAREQSLAVEGLDALIGRIPFPVLGIDTDNDRAFINETMLAFCEERHLEFTRSRAYHKNDQAWIEQKNGAVVRRMVGHERFSGVIAGQALAHLYQSVRLYVNFFQPSFKLRDKVRRGAKVKRFYHRPATPVVARWRSKTDASRSPGEAPVLEDKEGPLRRGLARYPSLAAARSRFFSQGDVRSSPARTSRTIPRRAAQDSSASRQAMATSHGEKADLCLHGRGWRGPGD